MDWFAVENNGGGDLMEMDLSGSLFGDLNDDVFVDADTLKHFVEPEEATSVNCPPAPAPPVVAAPLENGEFARSNREVQHNCHQATQSLTHDLSRLAWAQKRGAADPQAYAAFRNRFCLLAFSVVWLFFFFFFSFFYLSFFLKKKKDLVLSIER